MDYDKLRNYLKICHSEIKAINEDIKRKRKEIQAFEQKIEQRQDHISFLSNIHGQIFAAVSEGKSQIIIPMCLGRDCGNYESNGSLSEKQATVMFLLKEAGVHDLRVESIVEYSTRTSNSDPIETGIDTMVTFSIAQ